MPDTRREVLAKMGTGLVALTVSTAAGPLSPQAARAQGAPLRILTPPEGRTLEALGDTLLPGAAEAGMAHFVDDQLGKESPLLLLRYVDYPGSYTEFYKQCLQSLDQVARARYRQGFERLTPEQRTAIVRDVAQKNPPEWKGPPAPLFYFVTRNDAVDVFYGTPQGFEKLGIPYMAHILPKENW